MNRLSQLLCPLLLFVLHQITSADNYEIGLDNKSVMVAVGCFWCGEEAFEHYAPGVVEAVSGYAGGSNDNPTYRNHPGHYEVVLVEYDPTKTSYSTLLHYAWRNIDPFNGNGQFCDSGSSYRPAIFYANEEERLAAEEVLGQVLEENRMWSKNALRVPILPRPKFWKAEKYHQDYYIKNPGTYNYYKTACGRAKRLKQVWGNEVYECYHELESSCAFLTNVTNAEGDVVVAEINVKGIEEGKAALLPKNYVIFISIIAAVIGTLIIGYVIYFCHKKKLATSTSTSSPEKLKENQLTESNDTQENI